MSVQHVYIVGSKGAGNYGGFETFVDKLTEYHQDNKNIQYHIAWKGTEFKEFEHNGAHSFQIKVPDIGSAQAIFYDVKALDFCIKHIKKYNIEKPIVYVLACRIGPFITHYRKLVHKFGGQLFVNPDGHEWKRAKWSAPVRKYWKFSEKIMVKNADLLICDSKNIEKYIKNEYKRYNPVTTYIAYGSDITKSKLSEKSEIVLEWFNQHNISENEYYLVVGRFVPENNYETMIKEFMKSKTSRELVLITNVERNTFYNDLNKKTNFESDKRIKFVGTVYNQELLKYIRENAFAYIHGHEVGGTNPSLLEALGSTKLNLLLDVGFNKEVADIGALYWNKNNLHKLIDEVDLYDERQLESFEKLSKDRINQLFTWNKIVNDYEKVFMVR